ncbi:MAG: squalene--hopene cyclase [Acidobacteria bacterium]|nr:squalene--hopene cyclase [Acidobacteriota bacterium]
MSPSLHLSDLVSAAASRTSLRAVDALMAQQHAQGYWWADLTADTTLESDYILLELWRHAPQGAEWNPPSRARIAKAVQSILSRQLPDGGFNIYVAGPSEISASVKAYFALKLSGQPLDSEPMVRLRERIMALGGIQAANSYTKLNLSLFGLYPREHVPSVPPELMLFGDVIYEMSSWTRAIVIPLAITQSLNTGRPVPTGFNLDEIFTPGVSTAFMPAESFFSWKSLFHKVDRVFKLWERFGSEQLRRKAIKKAEEWMLERFAHSEGLAAIYPPMMYAIMALDVLGYPSDHPAVVEAVRQFEALIVEDQDAAPGGTDAEAKFYFQPCFSVVWDTAIAAYALGETGIASRDALRRCGDWLLTKECRRKGDWSVKRPDLEPSGWYFEFANEFYPDIDDTAMVLLALWHTGASDQAALDACVERAKNWLLGMQSSDGGWAAFDVDNNWQFLSDVPFADHNAMLDPTCPDITGRVIEALCRWGLPADHPAIQRGVEYLLKTQEPDGSWYGRWGVDYVYGTFLALRGLKAAGYSDREAPVLRAGEWLRSIQNADGGWGESCESYDKNAFIAAPSTPSQTAWAVLGLLAGGDETSSSVLKGVQHLTETQQGDGLWREALATGTGFPRVFYLNYHLYRNSFPVLALGEFLKRRPPND